MIIYKQGSAAYDRALQRTKSAIKKQNRRNRYTVAKKAGEPNPFSRVPQPPSAAQLEVIKEDRALKRALFGHTDQWWFDRIDGAIEEKFYRSKIYCLIWWDRCTNEVLDNDAWKARMKDYDFERDIQCDWDLVEYALHCCGYPPAKAHKLAFEASDRKRWRENRKKVYLCFECDATQTECNFAPRRCSACHLFGTMEEVS